MTDNTETPARDAATAATPQPTEPVETENTTMTESKAAAHDPKVAASETRSQPKTQTTPAPDTEAVATQTWTVGMVCLRTMCRLGERLREKGVWFCLRPRIR